MTLLSQRLRWKTRSCERAALFPLPCFQEAVTISAAFDLRLGFGSEIESLRNPSFFLMKLDAFVNPPKKRTVSTMCGPLLSMTHSARAPMAASVTNS